MNLQNLPQELIYTICESLCLHCQIDTRTPASFLHIDSQGERGIRKTQLDLCLLCKSWGYIAQRVLHHSYGFPERSDRGDVRFCRTICEKPELGRFVKRIYLRQISQLDWDLDKDDDAWLLKSLDKFSDILNLPPKPFNFSQGAWSSFIIPLILLQISTVEDLQIDTRNLDHLMQQIKKPSESHLHTFPQNVVKVTMSEGPHSQEVFPLRGPVDLSDTAGGGLLSNIQGFDILIIGNPTRQTIRSPLQLDSVRTLI